MVRDVRIDTFFPHERMRWICTGTGSDVLKSASARSNARYTVFNESVFDAEELRTIDSVLFDLGGMNGREVSDLSHEEAGWRLTEEGETIPCTAALIPREQPLTPTAAAQAAAVSARYGIATSA